MYGQPVNDPHGHPIAELVKTVLSQHTNDRNRDRSFAALRERLPTWEEVRDAPVEEIEEAMRFLYARAKLACEPAGAASTAALLAGKIAFDPGETVVIVVSGGNVATSTAVAILGKS
jgi:threonine dehydratase